MIKKEMKEIDSRISEQMQEGFDITSDNYPIRKLINLVQKGNIHDAPYQRGDVWDNPRKKALIETIMRYGGKKIPAIVLRRLDDGTMEIVDGKQRLLNAIIPFSENRFALNGFAISDLEGYKIEDIEEQLPKTYSSFMSTQIPVLLLSNMSDDEAIIYFHQVNSSGVQMTTGEKIHAMQYTPILETIELIKKHPIWDKITYVRRFNEYEYIAKMLLYARDTDVSQGIHRKDDKQYIIKHLNIYRSTEVPHSMINSVTKSLDFINNIMDKYEFTLSIRDLYNVFTYVNNYGDYLNKTKFGKFIKELYYFIHSIESSDMNIFRVIKNKYLEIGFNYNEEYYKWYSNIINGLYDEYCNGADWNELKYKFI